MNVLLVRTALMPLPKLDVQTVIFRMLCRPIVIKYQQAIAKIPLIKHQVVWPHVRLVNILNWVIQFVMTVQGDFIVLVLTKEKFKIKYKMSITLSNWVLPPRSPTWSN